MKTKACLFSFINFVFLFYLILISTAGAANKIMPLGDSITDGSDIFDETAYRRKLYLLLTGAGYDPDFVGSFAVGIPNDFDKEHEGHPGWRDDEIVNGRLSSPGEGQLSDWLVAFQPEIVLLHIGTNGINSSPDDVEAILDEIDAFSPNVWVLLARIINRSCSTDVTPCLQSQTTMDFNDNVEDMAWDRINNPANSAFPDKIKIVDMEAGAGIDYRLSPVGDMVDNLHPMETGYDKMADLWFAALVEILQRMNCELPVGHLDYCRDCGPCAEGEADCDTDGECQGGLICVPDIQLPGTDTCQTPPTVCPHPVGHLDYCRDCGPCAEGEGDCDNNSECESGLTCVQIPGVDTCQSDVCTLPVGHLDYCRECGPCAEDEGDCDSDSECQSGLTCVQIPGVDTCQAPPPACPHPVGHLDYCRDCGPCPEGEGDCDNNSECESGLTCAQIPGVDTCRSDGCTLPVGHLDYCRDCGPCAAGQGDCDNDGECQSGLVCPQILGTDTCQAP